MTTIILITACLVFAGLWMQLPENIALKRAKEAEKRAKDELMRVEARNDILVRKLATLIESQPDTWFDEWMQPVMVRRETPYQERTIRVRHETAISEYELSHLIKVGEWERYEKGLRHKIAAQLAGKILEQDLFVRWNTGGFTGNGRHVEHRIMLELEVVKPDKAKYRITEPTLPLIPRPNIFK